MLIAFGIMLLLIGLIASFYVEIKNSRYEIYPGTFNTMSVKVYPYRSIGLVLTLAGVAVVGLGLGFVMSLTEKV